MILYMSDSESDQALHILDNETDYSDYESDELDLIDKLNQQYKNLRIMSHVELIKKYMKLADSIYLRKEKAFHNYDRENIYIHYFKGVKKNRYLWEEFDEITSNKKYILPFVHKFWAHHALAPKFERGICDKICSYL